MTTRGERHLHGMKVLDFTQAVAGSFCTRLLCDMGAQVIKVELPPTGDRMRLLGPFSGRSWKMPPSMSPVFVYANAGKQSISLDLKKPQAIELIREMVAQVDVVVENFTPHVMKGYRLTYEDLRNIREDLIMCSITGYGQTGALADYPAGDAVGQAMGGMAALCGEQDGYPYLAGNGIADTFTATTAAMAILAALLRRAQTGEGEYIDISMMDSIFSADCAAAPYYLASRGEYSMARGGRFFHLACPWGVFKGPQGRYLAIMAPGDLPWRRLAELMGRPELIDDPRFSTMAARLQNRDAVHEIIERFLQGFETAEEAHRALCEARLMAGIVLDPWEVANHPQVAERQMVWEIPYPFVGSIPTAATAPRFSSAPISVGRAPFIGEHNRAVLRGLLGLSDGALDQLYAQGILYEEEAVARLADAPGGA